MEKIQTEKKLTKKQQKINNEIEIEKQTFEEIKLVLLGKPKSTQHIYGYHGKIKYMMKDAKELKESYIEQIKQQYGKEIIKCLVEMEIKLYFNDNRKRDFDNYHKISLDSLSGNVIEDDSLVKRATIEKFLDKENPRIEFTIKKYNNENKN